MNNNIVLNATSIIGCAAVLMKDYGACGGNSNITVIATFEVIGESNVIFHRNKSYITLSLNECKMLLILDIQVQFIYCILILLNFFLCTLNVSSSIHPQPLYVSLSL